LGVLGLRKSLPACEAVFFDVGITGESPNPMLEHFLIKWFGGKIVEQDFQEGQTVQLKSGGPMMTIKGIGKYGMGATKDSALCVWFEGKNLKEAVFEIATLTTA
jgi:uncharacterized protein YodC (DUF2158 family)